MSTDGSFNFADCHGCGDACASRKLLSCLHGLCRDCVQDRNKKGFMHGSIERDLICRQCEWPKSREAAVGELPVIYIHEVADPKTTPGVLSHYYAEEASDCTVRYLAGWRKGEGDTDGTDSIRRYTSVFYSGSTIEDDVTACSRCGLEALDLSLYLHLVCLDCLQDVDCKEIICDKCRPVAWNELPDVIAGPDTPSACTTRYLVGSLNGTCLEDVVGPLVDAKILVLKCRKRKKFSQWTKTLFERPLDPNLDPDQTGLPSVEYLDNRMQLSATITVAPLRGGIAALSSVGGGMEPSFVAVGWGQYCYVVTPGGTTEIDVPFADIANSVLPFSSLCHCVDSGAHALQILVLESRQMATIKLIYWGLQRQEDEVLSVAVSTDGTVYLASTTRRIVYNCPPGGDYFRPHINYTLLPRGPQAPRAMCTVSYTQDLLVCERFSSTLYHHRKSGQLISVHNPTCGQVVDVSSDKWGLVYLCHWRPSGVSVYSLESRDVLLLSKLQYEAWCLSVTDDGHHLAVATLKSPPKLHVYQLPCGILTFRKYSGNPL